MFHQPLVRAVAYESQLKSDRAEWHRRLAEAIENRDPASADGAVCAHLGEPGKVEVVIQGTGRAWPVIDRLGSDVDRECGLQLVLGGENLPML